MLPVNVLGVTIAGLRETEFNGLHAMTDEWMLADLLKTGEGAQ